MQVNTNPSLRQKQEEKLYAFPLPQFVVDYIPWFASIPKVTPVKNNDDNQCSNYCRRNWQQYTDNKNDVGDEIKTTLKQPSHVKSSQGWMGDTFGRFFKKNGDNNAMGNGQVAGRGRGY